MLSNVLSVAQDGTEGTDEVMEGSERLLSFFRLIAGVVSGVTGCRIKHWQSHFNFALLVGGARAAVTRTITV